MQYTKRDWRNRNIIKTNDGLKWLTVPVEVKGKYLQKIRDTKIAENKWQISHWESIKQSYLTAKKFKEIAEWLEPLYKKCKYEYISEINYHFISKICKVLDFKTEFKFSSEFELAEEKTERLINICRDLSAKHYLTGESAKNYLDENRFKDEGIQVEWKDYSNYDEYNQIHPPFSHNVSIIDTLMNLGIEETKRYIKNGCRIYQ